jgi:tetratricopeptide (TPR) repeat protein
LQKMKGVSFLLQHAQRALAGQHAEIIKLLTPLLEATCSNAQRVELHRLLCEAYRNLDNYELALTHVLAALEHFDNRQSNAYAVALHDCAAIEVRQGHAEDAKRHLDEAMKLFFALDEHRGENFGVVLMTYARWHAMQHHVQKAIETLHMAKPIMDKFKHSANYATLMSDYALYHRTLKQWEPCIAYSVRANAALGKLYGYKSETFLRSLYQVGQDCLSGGRTKEADECFAKAVAMDPSLPLCPGPKAPGETGSPAKGAKTAPPGESCTKASRCKGGCGEPGVEFCSSECIQSFWMRSGCKDCVRCDYCEQWFSALIVCGRGQHKYCTQKACQNRHVTEGH